MRFRVGFYYFAWVIGGYSVFLTRACVIVEFLFVFVESRGFGGNVGGLLWVSGLLREFSVVFVGLVGVWWVFCELTC